jgi:hypothetical protein
MTDLLGIGGDEQRMRSRAQVIAIVISAGFVAAVYFHYWLAAYEGLSYPRATYLCRTDDNMPLATMHVPWSVVSKRHCFGDLYAPYLQTLRFAPYGSEGIFPSNYLPFTHALMVPATLLPYDLLLPSYLACFAAGTFAFCLWGVRELPWLDRVIFALPVALMSYPPQFLMDRGNLEGLVFAFTALFYICYSQRKTNAAACFLAAAIAMKGYPVAYSLFFALNAQWRQLFLCAAVSIVLTLASAAIFEGGMVHTAVEAVSSIKRYGASIQSEDGMRHACSLYGLLSIIRDSVVAWPLPSAGVSLVMAEYKWVQWVAALGILVACVAWPLREWEILSLLTFSFLLLPLSSPDYRLIYLFLPMVAFIRCPKSELRALPIATLAATLCIPKAFIYISYEITIGCIINPLLMVGAAIFLCIRAAARRDDDASTLYRRCAARCSQLPLLARLPTRLEGH